ncbi:MAG: hypothetical protein HY667_06805 [Chloroflexi bacterium]|nr:hypothetical protein [Chloroflexota bacterium]
MYDTIFVEEHHRPTVMLAFKYFENDAMSAASSRGMPVVRVVLEPVVSECTVMEEIDAGITGVMDQVVAALVKTLTAEEKSPQLKGPEKPVRIVFKGTLEEVNRFFYRRGWTDGLPVIPPTDEAVAEMLTGTDLPPDYLVAKLVPRLGKATVERIAINAVVAGCLPTYMPLLIAGVKALVTNRVADMMQVSTGSWAPFWIVNGPVRKDLNINDSYGAMNPGNIANATIGRALTLITRNIRGIRPGIEDMSVLGHPGKYTMVVAENEEDNPWEPLHVEHGFKKEDSTVTLSFPQSYDDIYSYGTDDKSLLKTITCNITPQGLGILGIILTPTNARSLASRGWTKDSIKAHIMENARVPWDHHPRYYAGDYLGDESLPPFKPQDSVPILLRVANQLHDVPVRLYVFGGVGSWIGILRGGRDIVTEKAELPANWEKLIQKYKNVVPTYARY